MPGATGGEMPLLSWASVVTGPAGEVTAADAGNCEIAGDCVPVLTSVLAGTVVEVLRLSCKATLDWASGEDEPPPHAERPVMRDNASAMRFSGKEVVSYGIRILKHPLGEPGGKSERKRISTRHFQSINTRFDK